MKQITRRGQTPAGDPRGAGATSVGGHSAQGTSRQHLHRLDNDPGSVAKRQGRLGHPPSPTSGAGGAPLKPRRDPRAPSAALPPVPSLNPGGQRPPVPGTTSALPPAPSDLAPCPGEQERVQPRLRAAPGPSRAPVASVQGVGAARQGGEGRTPASEMATRGHPCPTR